MKRIIMASLLLTSTLSYGFWSTSKELSQQTTCIEGLVGTFSNKIADIVDTLVSAKEIVATDSPDLVLFRGQNRAIFYGPPGNGKTTIAKKIAQATGSFFIELPGPTIVDKYVGEAGAKIVAAFNKAREEIAFSETTVVIFIDEIDAIASKIRDEGYHAEALRITQALWTQLDSIKDDPRILVIGATNNFKDLDKTFVDRFGANVIEIKNPTKDMRFELLTFYCNLYSKSRPCDKETLSWIAKQSEGFSSRALEDLIISSARDAQKKNLKKIDTTYLLNDFTLIKTKTLGLWQDRLKGYLSKISANAQKHAYPHLQFYSLLIGAYLSTSTLIQKASNQ